MVQLAFVQVRLKKKCTFSCFSLSRRFISCSHLKTLSYLFKLNHEERKCHRHTNSLQKIVQDIHLRTFGMINENFCKGTKQNIKDIMEKIEITFNIMFLPNVKYPAAVKVGHWWCIWIVSFWTWRSNLGDPSTVDTWHIVMKGCFD